MHRSQEATRTANTRIPGWRSAEDGVKKLPRGKHGIPREEVERSQRGRMLRACLEHLGREGKVNVSEIVDGAQVSRKAFYELFTDCDACISEALVTLNVILGDEMLAAIERADSSDPTYKIRTAVREFCEMASDEPAITVAVAGTTFSLNHPTRQVWLEVLQARCAIILSYWEEAQMRDPDLSPATPDRVMAAVRFMEGRVLEEIAAGREAKLPEEADAIAESFIEIIGG